MMKPKSIILASLGLLCFIVFLQNTQVVSFRFLFWKLSMSRIILLPMVLACGFVIGFLFGKQSDQ